MNSDIEALNEIKSGKPVRIFLPLKDSHRVRAQCVYQETRPPQFSLIFQPGELAVEEIDRSGSCIVSIDIGGPTLSLEAKILNIVNSQILEMVIQKSMSHEQMREFFRVDAEAKVISKSFQTRLRKNRNKTWSLKGKTVDISGSGILAIFNEKPPADHQVKLEITTPSTEPQIVHVLAHTVRRQELNDGRYEVAYHFDDITTTDRDKIIGCCLELQRKMLRLKVQVKDF